MVLYFHTHVRACTHTAFMTCTGNLPCYITEVGGIEVCNIPTKFYENLPAARTVNSLIHENMDGKIDSVDNT